MEARQTLTGTSVPMGLMAVLAISVVIALAVLGAAMSKSFGASSASVSSAVHPAAGTVLRQDNPVQSSSQLSAPVGTHLGRSSGTQTDEGSTFGFTANDGNGSQSDLTRVLPTGTQGYNPGWDAKSVREGHGQ